MVRNSKRAPQGRVSSISPRTPRNSLFGHKHSTPQRYTSRFASPEVTGSTGVEGGAPPGSVEASTERSSGSLLSMLRSKQNNVGMSKRTLSSGSASQSPVKYSRVGPVSSLSDKLRAKLGKKSSVFDLLDIDSSLRTYMYYDGLGESAVGRKWFSYGGSGCSKCLMMPESACVCYDNRSNNFLKRIARECLLTLNFKLSEASFATIIQNSVEYRCYTVLFDVFEYRVQYRTRFLEKTRPYLKFVKGSFLHLDRYLDFQHYKDMINSYNEIWSYMTKNKLDMLACSSDASSNPKFVELWDRQLEFDGIRKALEVEGSSRYGRRGFGRNYNGPSDYIIQILKHNFKRYGSLS
ncbi:similar to Naumovozyma dairenensis hypothetical protein NDAI_0A00850 [Naumovozyma dairenensis CBS 421] [Maudiozyma saulgeensis]|uniref:Uncharacterized protein n=1 Tax=Maudiozyma saulgeensis TaxID=1789683 RepID=A0A1X7R9W5_9SACH|nr:similar to Naumovozyma dairenensis hypothetical protein NDAI_0A00850 [Naumovozyma dairenensis CBS 421] [Kazachstania saulgeensis]